MPKPTCPKCHAPLTQDQVRNLAALLDKENMKSLIGAYTSSLKKRFKGWPKGKKWTEERKAAHREAIRKRLAAKNT